MAKKVNTLFDKQDSRDQIRIQVINFVEKLGPILTIIGGAQFGLDQDSLSGSLVGFLATLGLSPMISNYLLKDRLIFLRNLKLQIDNISLLDHDIKKVFGSSFPAPLSYYCIIVD